MSKFDKNDLKRLMKEEKAKRIESPLAKYNSNGQLTCVLCTCVIKSELYWSAHLNSKSHLEQIKALKQSNKRSNDDTQSKQEQDIIKKPKIDDTPPTTIKKIEVENEVSSKEINKNDTTSLPRGFFDDKTKDDKIRKVQKVDLDVEFKQFKKEIQMEEVKQEIQEDLDDDEREFDKELEEVDDLLNKWSRIEDLHRKKEAITQTKSSQQSMENNLNENKDSTDDEDCDIEKEMENVMSLTLRTKHRC